MNTSRPWIKQKGLNGYSILFAVLELCVPIGCVVGVGCLFGRGDDTVASIDGLG
jgi:hypothetical protein